MNQFSKNWQTVELTEKQEAAQKRAFEKRHYAEQGPALGGAVLGQSAQEAKQPEIPYQIGMQRATIDGLSGTVEALISRLATVSAAPQGAIGQKMETPPSITSLGDAIKTNTARLDSIIGQLQELMNALEL